MICWCRKIILRRGTAPLWSATLLWKVNLKLFLTSKYLPLLRDLMANLFRVTIQVGEDLSGASASQQGHLWELWVTWDCIQSVLCKLFGIWESSYGVWFSILVLHPQILLYILGLREKGMFTVKFKCHLHLEAFTGSRGYSFGNAIVWTLWRQFWAFLRSWIYHLCTINHLTSFLVPC